MSQVKDSAKVISRDILGDDTTTSDVWMSLIGVESGWRPAAVGPPTRYGRAVGLGQLLPATFREMVAEHPDRFPKNPSISDPYCNLTASALYFNRMLQKYNNTQLAVAAYNTGPGNLDKTLRAIGKNPQEVTLQDLNNHLPDPTQTVDYIQKVARGSHPFVSGESRTGGSTTNSPTTQKLREERYTRVAEGPAQEAGNPVFNNQGLDTALTATSTPLPIYEGLDTPPWWVEASTKITTVGNPRNKGQVVFKIFNQKGEPLTTTFGGDTPVELRLNCSLTSLDIQLRHKINHTPTRTGVHLTFWGMEPDIITASGTTGAAMNALGLTHIMSTTSTHLPDALRQTAETLTSPEPFKVSAHDAFVELLALFKHNAITRFRPTNPGGAAGRDQLDHNVWSPHFGSSLAVAGVRANDVMSRGYVVMELRDSAYLGFFKSLDFTEDAGKPFSWAFNFTFQVQKRYNRTLYPGLS